MDQKIYLSSEFSVRVCTECDTVYAVLQRFLDERQNDHETFYCPNGHRRHFPQMSDQEKLEKQLNHCRTNRDRWKDEHDIEQDKRRAVERSRSSLRGAFTKMKRRYINESAK